MAEWGNAPLRRVTLEDGGSKVYYCSSMQGFRFNAQVAAERPRYTTLLFPWGCRLSKVRSFHPSDMLKVYVMYPNFLADNVTCMYSMDLRLRANQTRSANYYFGIVDY